MVFGWVFIWLWCGDYNKASCIYDKKLILLKKNVPEKDISFFGKSNMSTVEEAKSLKKIFGDKRVRLLLVTTPFHTRRAKAIFGDILPNAEFRVVASPYEEFTQKWWTHRGSAIPVIWETFKIFYYHIGGATRSSDNSPIKSGELKPSKIGWHWHVTEKNLT
jgi:uncharacterized SAM-binding protein YcdF (DUF218 family)